MITNKGTACYVTGVSSFDNFSMLESKSANDQRRGSDDTGSTSKTHSAKFN